ncbi:MAG: hypothetical protein WBN04_18590 [Paracoccaceae bacterium]
MTRGRAAFWIVFAATLAVYAVMVFWTLPVIAAAAGGLAPFDMRPSGYSEPQARAFLASLSPDGRSIYLTLQHKLDLAYPALLAATLIMSLVWLFPQLSRIARVALCALPVAGAIFDYIENAKVAAMLRASPGDVTAQQIELASRATILKSGYTTLAMGLVLIGLVPWVLRQKRLRDG